MIKKAIIPSAGLGTRLLPVTKETPKEMLPVFLRAKGKMYLKPMLQAVFEQLFEAGFREFFFIVGRGKRTIEDHFTPDNGFVETLKKKNKNDIVESLQNFYKRINNSTMVFVNQPEPKGFGDAVLRARSLITKDFLVHAGDTYIISPRNQYLKKLIKVHNEQEADTTFIMQEIEDPRQYGVVESKSLGNGIFKVERVVEKPEKPSTKLAIMPIYIFNSTIFEALQEVPLGKGGELQLTDGIQKQIDKGLKVIAVELTKKDVRLDIGTPETFWDSLDKSHKQHSSFNFR